MSNVFESVLSVIEPAEVRDMIASKLNETLALVLENNRRVAQVNEAKNTDPNSVEYQDAVWRRVVSEESDAELVAAEARYQKLVKESDALLKKLREGSKKHMTPALSETQVQELKKSLNDGKQTIAESVIAAKSFAEMADQFLTLLGKPIEGGVLSLMPQPDSLLNSRPRKSTATAGSRGEGGYMTRVSEIALDGKPITKKVKVNGEMVERAHFNYAAEELSRRFNDKQFEQNKVTALEIEEAYYAAAGKEFRASGEMPETFEFEFKRDIAVQNPNDDSSKVEPQTVKISVKKWVKPATENATENATAPTNSTDTGDAPAVEKK